MRKIEGRDAELERLTGEIDVAQANLKRSGEVLRKLRAQEKTRDIPVIILSNYDEEDLVARGLRLGAHEYLIKARTTPTSLSEGIEDWLKE